MAKNDIHVVVAKNDIVHPRWGVDDMGEIVMETYVNKSSLQDAKNHIKICESNMGKCRIARLVFVDENGEDEAVIAHMANVINRAKELAALE